MKLFLLTLLLGTILGLLFPPYTQEAAIGLFDKNFHVLIGGLIYWFVNE